MNEQLKEIALRVAKDCACPCGMQSDSVFLEFAARFLAALPKPEPVGVCDTENRIRWGGNDSSHRYSSAPNWLSVGTHVYVKSPPSQTVPTRMQIDATIADLSAKSALTDDFVRDAERYFPFEFEVWQDSEMVASASGNRDEALREAMNYAAQYQQDGQVRVFEVTRTLCGDAAIAAEKGGAA